MISSKTRDRFPIEEIHEAMHNEFIEGKDFAPYQKTQISLDEALQFLNEVESLFNAKQYQTARFHYVSSIHAVAYQKFLRKCYHAINKDKEIKESLHFRFGENDLNVEELKQWITQKI
jgi:hypothetical protein